MPVPKPKSNESEREYISRCEKVMHEENQSKPEEKNVLTRKLLLFATQLGAKRVKFNSVFAYDKGKGTIFMVRLPLKNSVKT